MLNAYQRANAIDAGVLAACLNAHIRQCECSEPEHAEAARRGLLRFDSDANRYQITPSGRALLTLLKG